MKTTNLTPPPDEENKPGQLNDSGFNSMVYDVDHEIEEADTVKKIVDHVPELKRMNEDIEKATTAVINAILGLESAFQKYRIVEKNLDDKVMAISNKVDAINTHVDNVVKEAQKKMQMTIKVDFTDEDKKKVTELLANDSQSLTEKLSAHTQEVNRLFEAQCNHIKSKLEVCDGTYIGHRIQSYALTFFAIGVAATFVLICYLLYILFGT